MEQKEFIKLARQKLAQIVARMSVTPFYNEYHCLSILKDAYEEYLRCFDTKGE